MALTPRSLQVLRTARYYDLGDPKGSRLWYAFHGYGQLALGFAAVFSKVASPGIRLLVPEALSRFYLDGEGREHGSTDRVGASWMTREDRLSEIHDYLGYMDQLAERVEETTPEPKERVALGFSQGVHTAARWVALGKHPPSRLIAWGAPLPRDLPLPELGVRLRGVPIVLVHGTTDSAFGPLAARAELDRLEAAGLAVVHRSHPGGHRLSRALIRELMTEGQE